MSCLGGLGLAWVAILGDEVIGEKEEVAVRCFTDVTLANFDHFSGAGRVMVRVIFRLPARRYGALRGLFEAPL